MGPRRYPSRGRSHFQEANVLTGLGVDRRSESGDGSSVWRAAKQQTARGARVLHHYRTGDGDFGRRPVHQAETQEFGNERHEFVAIVGNVSPQPRR